MCVLVTLTFFGCGGEAPQPSQHYVTAASDTTRLTRIGRAFEEHHKKHNVWPRPYADHTVDGFKELNTGLSWRVHLLPFLGEESLYSEFRLNEPWDSANNKPLISRIPDVFVSDASIPPGHTTYHVTAGPLVHPLRSRVSAVFSLPQTATEFQKRINSVVVAPNITAKSAGDFEVVLTCRWERSAGRTFVVRVPERKGEKPETGLIGTGPMLEPVPLILFTERYDKRVFGGKSAFQRGKEVDSTKDSLFSVRGAPQRDGDFVQLRGRVLFNHRALGTVVDRHMDEDEFRIRIKTFGAHPWPVTLNHGQGRSIQVMDAHSETVLVAKYSPDFAEPWTKPGGVELGNGIASESLALVDGQHVLLMCDSSIKRVSPGIGVLRLTALFTRNGDVQETFRHDQGVVANVRVSDLLVSGARVPFRPVEPEGLRKNYKRLVEAVRTGGDTTCSVRIDGRLVSFSVEKINADQTMIVGDVEAVQ